MSEKKGHYAKTENSDKTYQVLYNNEVILESDQVVILTEYYDGRAMPAVIYFPRSSLSKLNISRTNRSSHCPIKGDASYWSYQGAESGMWSYENPIQDLNQIKDHFGFDQKKGFSVKIKGE